MCDLCRLIFFGLVVDLFRSRAALEAEVLMLKQQIIVLRRGKPNRMSFLAVDRFILVGSAACFRRPTMRSPSFDPIPWFAGAVQASGCFGVGSPGMV
ncbi:MAG: hypothetical protein WCD25_09660, partial [Pseudolabrys sp.]